MTGGTSSLRTVLRLTRSPLLAARIARRYHRTYGRWPNLIAPHSFSEKIQYRKLFDRRPYLTQTSDKLAVRDYAKRLLGKDLAPELLFRTTDPSTIPFASLPQRFVVKATHGSGWNVVVHDRDEMDKCALLTTCERWMRTNYASSRDEWAYTNVPRQIIVEEFLDDGSGISPADIKLFVFNQRVRVVQIDAARFGEHRRKFFDPQWNELRLHDFVPPIEDRVEMPSRLAEIIRYAEALAQDTDMLRVDFYQVGNRVCFGEMTHTPGSGLTRLYPSGWDDQFGAWWEMGSDGRSPPHESGRAR
jgi:TupA-like ATPgrasp